MIEALKPTTVKSKKMQQHHLRPI